MISIKTFLSGTLETVDAVIGNFVNIAYNNFIHGNAELITLLFTLYIMMLGYRFLTHSQTDLNAISKHLIVLLIVYGMLMSWQLYNLFIYNIFTNEPNTIAQVLVSSAGKLRSGPSVATSLDGIYETIIKVTMEFFGQVSFSGSGIAFAIYGALVFIIGSIMCVVALLLFIYAKMMMAVLLALGPIFIIFILWDSTKSMFASWLRSLITLAFIPIVTSAILVLMLSVINVTLPNISQPSSSLQFSGIAPFLGLSLATGLILSQVINICSSLCGGISISNLSRGAGIAASVLENTGVASGSRKAAEWARSKINKPIKRTYRNR